MAGRLKLGVNVFDMALKRLVEEYDAGHRVVVSISGGKDSGVCLELAIMAAELTGNLPVDACTRDEEIAYPGTYEYLERVHERPEVNLVWLVANQPIPNAFDRGAPYWWVFDPLVDPDDWVRKPPSYALHTPELNIEAMVTKAIFPVAEGQELRSILGLRVQESPGRLLGVHSSNGTTTEPFKPTGVRSVRPIYDWTDGDIWLAHRKFGWDYNSAYDVMHRHGVPKAKLRLGPPTMNPAGGESLRQVGSIAWPDWWNRVCRRLPSVRTYAKYGAAAVLPQRRLGESWEQCFHRLCIDTAPGWIADRAIVQRDKVLSSHRHHAPNMAFPQMEPGCRSCFGVLGSWAALARALYLGDPFSNTCRNLPYMEPEFFRPGAGWWNNVPTEPVKPKQSA